MPDPGNGKRLLRATCKHLENAAIHASGSVTFRVRLLRLPVHAPRGLEAAVHTLGTVQLPFLGCCVWPKLGSFAGPSARVAARSDVMALTAHADRMAREVAGARLGARVGEMPRGAAITPRRA